MKYLLLRGVRRRSNAVHIDLARQVLDVGEDNISRLTVKSMILSSSNGSDMRCDSGIDDDILLPCVFLDRDPSQDLEAVPIVNLIRDGSKHSVQPGKWERVLSDLTQRKAKTCIS